MDERLEGLREAVGIFSNEDDLQAAIDELLSSGFHRAELSLLAGQDVVNEKLRGRYTNATVIADDVTVPRTAYVSPEAIGEAQGGVVGTLGLCRRNHCGRRNCCIRRHDTCRNSWSNTGWRNRWDGWFVSGQVARR